MRAAAKGRRFAREPRAACLMLLGLALAGSATAQGLRPDPRLRYDGPFEVAPFRIIEIEGHVLAHYLWDDSVTRMPLYGQAGTSESRQGQSSTRLEPFLLAHAYVYHPNLLMLDLGGGPVIDRGRYTSDGDTTQASKSLYNLQARATFLREKPYRGGVFFEHLNPVQSVGPGQVMLTESERYGFDFALLDPVTPMPLTLDVSRSHTQGHSADRTQNDRVDLLRLGARSSLGKLGDTQMSFSTQLQESESGSLGLPIQATRSRHSNFGADTRLHFGANRQYELFNTIAFTRSGTSRVGGVIGERRDTRFGLDLSARPSDRLSGYARYHFDDVAEIDQTSSAHALNGGLTYRVSPELSATLGAKGQSARSTQMRSTQAGLDGSLTYRARLLAGEASASYAVAYSTHDQQASQAQGRVIGEVLALSDITPVPLRRTQVVDGSVVVTNGTRTQVFIEGLDYVLSTIGVTTRIRRLVGGNILDGQEVLVDYAYDVGGTYASAQLDQMLSLGWSLANLLGAYVRVSDASPRIRSGAPTFERNPAQDWLIGARLDWLAWDPMDLYLGGNAEHQQHREAIAPYERRSWEAYAQMALPGVRGTLRIATRRSRSDYADRPLQGVDLSATDLRLWFRLPVGVDVNLDAGRTRDVGAEVARSHSYLVAKAQWRVRRFLVTFDLGRTHEQQGGTSRRHGRGSLLLRRDF